MTDMGGQDWVFGNRRGRYERVRGYIPPSKSPTMFQATCRFQTPTACLEYEEPITR